MASFDLRLRGEKRKAAKAGELIDEETLTDVTWSVWRKNADRWRADQAKYMPLLGVEAAETTISGRKDRADDNDDNSDDTDDDDDDDNNNNGMSSTTKATSSITPVARHDEVLGLPSDFSAEEITKYDLQLLADYEARIRVGQAFDQLEVVRRTVMHLSAFVKAKKDQAHARKENMRANITNRYSVVVRDDAARKYNSIYDCLVKLRPGLAGLSQDMSDPASYLRRIDIPGDLTITNMKAAREQGDRHRSGSWIWWAFEDVMSVVAATEGTTAMSARPNTRAARGSTSKGKARAHADPELDSGSDSKMTDTTKYTTWCTFTLFGCGFCTNMLESVDRAQWFRAWQEKLRCDEAINILCADFRATIRGFAALGDRWLEASRTASLQAGERAYAVERHRIFHYKSRQCQLAYDQTRKKGVAADQLDHTLVCCPVRVYPERR